MSHNVEIERLDHYTLKLGGRLLVTANEELERKIRNMSQTEIESFMHIMGGEYED